MGTIIKRFDSVSAMVRFQNQPYKTHTFNVEQGDRLRKDWHGVTSTKKADELLQHGYKVEDSSKIVTPIFETSGQVKIKTLGVVGYAPHVPNAIKGLPLSMRNRKTIEQKNKVVDLFYSTSFGSNCSAEDAKTKGEKMVQIIKEHESKGIRVNLWIVSAGTEDYGKGDDHIIVTKFKDAQHPLNIGRLYYPLMHIAYLRVHMFRVWNRMITNPYTYTLWVTPQDKVLKALNIDGQRRILI